jgi:nitrate/nitrite-specific signal transduction histidine kinase
VEGKSFFYLSLDLIIFIFFLFFLVLFLFLNAGVASWIVLPLTGPLCEEMEINSNTFKIKNLDTGEYYDIDEAVQRFNVMGLELKSTFPFPSLPSFPSHSSSPSRFLSSPQ